MLVKTNYSWWYFSFLLLSFPSIPKKNVKHFLWSMYFVTTNEFHQCLSRIYYCSGSMQDEFPFNLTISIQFPYPLESKCNLHFDKQYPLKVMKLRRRGFGRKQCKLWLPYVLFAQPNFSVIVTWRVSRLFLVSAPHQRHCSFDEHSRGN